MVTTQARHLLSRMQGVRDFSNRMSRPRMSEASRRIELNFRNRFEVSLGNRLQVEKTYRFRRGGARRVALEAEGIDSSACPRFEFRGMGIVADKALAFLVRSMKHRALLNLMALRAQVASRRE